MSSLQHKTEFAAEARKGAPAVAVAGLSSSGVSLNDIVLIATLLYVVLQAAYLLWRWRRRWLQERQKDLDQDRSDD